MDGNLVVGDTKMDGNLVVGDTHMIGTQKWKAVRLICTQILYTNPENH